MTALRVRLVAPLLALLLLACTATSQPLPDPATAARLSAEITAAETYHRETMRAAGATLAEGSSALRAVTVAGERLEAAMRVASADLVVYLDGGPTPDVAFREMRAARANLSLVWRAANGDD